jgi:hypothetical protein
MDNDIYQKNNSVRKLHKNSSVPEITFRHNGPSSVSYSKHSSPQSFAISQTKSIFKEKYDNNIEKYLSTITTYNRYNKRKNVSSGVGSLMSPESTGTKDRRFNL